jgi:hypothetical protein
MQGVSDAHPPHEPIMLANPRAAVSTGSAWKTGEGRRRAPRVKAEVERGELRGCSLFDTVEADRHPALGCKAQEFHCLWRTSGAAALVCWGLTLIWLNSCGSSRNGARGEAVS